MAYKFAVREDGNPGCCRCGTEISKFYVTGKGIKGPPVYATEEGWLALCEACYALVNKEVYP